MGHDDRFRGLLALSEQELGEDRQRLRDSSIR